MINDSALAFGRRIYVRALVVIGSPAYAEESSSSNRLGKNTTYMKHADCTKLEEKKEKKETQSKY